MEATEIAKIIKNEVNNAVKELSQKTFYRGVVDTADGYMADIFIEGSTTATPNITCLDSYLPVAGDTVLVLSIGLTGANFLCIGKTDAVDVDHWHIVGAAGEPIFYNNWINHTVGTYPQCGFMKDRDGFVHLQGLVKGGTVGDGYAIFILPVGYRPLYSPHIAIVSDGSFGNIRITTAGWVIVQVGRNGWVSLDNITFKAA